MKTKLFLSTFLLTIANIVLLTTSSAQTIAGGGRHSIAVCIDKTVKTWGSNNMGQLGNGTNTDSNIPVQVSSLTNVIAIAEGAEDHSIALKNDGTVRSWGYNNYGQLGNGTNTNSNIPVSVSSLTNITAIAGGYGHSLALKNDSTVWAWGHNLQGQFGNGTNTDTNVPVQVNSLTGITVIAGRQYHSIAVKNDGTVWTWGYNAQGQLGNGTNTDSNVPVQVPSLTGITAIAAGWGHTLALKNDGTVWAWGYNLYGGLGNGNNTNSNLPVQVSSLTGVIDIAGGVAHSLALKNDGTVWAWGMNNNGQLGNGTNTNTNFPVQVNSLTGITSIAAGGDYHSLALKNDGTLWAWGINTFGQLGNGTNTDNNVPIQVNSLCIVCAATTFTQSLTICAGQSVTVGSNTYTIGGTYHDTLSSANGCDSIIVTTLTVNSIFNTSKTETICFGDSIFLQENYQSASGTYYDTLSSTNGCDSMVTTTLNVNAVFNNSATVSICSDDSIFLQGNFQTATGVYYDSLTAMNGCDSVVTTNLTVFSTSAVTQNISICNGDSILLNGSYQNTTGIFYDTLNSTNGCDSIVTTNLTVLFPAAASQSISICTGDSIFLSGSYQTVAGSYIDTLLASNGCDSIVTSNLAVLTPASATQSISICSGDSVFLSGSYQTISGNYFDTLIASNGCDSIVTTNLTVLLLRIALDWRHN